MSSVLNPDGAPEIQGRKRTGWRRYAFMAAGAVIVIVTFAFVLPKIANYGEVWDAATTLTWQWALALIGAVALNLATFAPPWMIVLPGLGFRRALEMTQASTALSLVVPAGTAVGMAGSWAMLRGAGFKTAEIARAIMLTGVWNQFANLAFPVLALFMLKQEGGDTALLATVAFVGVGLLGVAIALLLLVLVSDPLARGVGDAVARAASWGLARIRRGPVRWGGEDFARFRIGAVELLARRWHVLTLATLAGSLTVFLILVLSLRAVGVSAAEVSLVEAFAAWSLARLIGEIPITPGGFGVIELGLTTALVAFGGPNAEVVAAVLIYRFLTVVPTLVFGGIAAITWRSHHALPADCVAERRRAGRGER